MAAVLSADMDKTDKVVTMIAECRDMKLAILPPDINRCDYAFTPLADAGAAAAPDAAAGATETARATGAILYGLGAIKGLGQAAIDAILEARRAGPFRDLFDLCRRIDPRKINRRVLESLIKAGALDGLGADRATLMASLTAALTAAERHAHDHAAGQTDLFGTGAAVTHEAADYVAVPPWSEAQRLEGEKETLGLYLTGHPIARYAAELARMTGATIVDLKPTTDATVVVAGLVVGLRTMQTRRGDRMAFVTLDDRTGRLELAVFADLYNQYRELLVKDSLLVVEGHVSVDEYTGGFKMSAEKLYNVEQARAAFGRRLVIEVDEERAGNGFVAELRELLGRARGGCPVYLNYHNRQATAEIALGEEWKVLPSTSVLEGLQRLAGERNVHLDYREQRAR
jgi:DNA polymerase-3 subunit alpha